MDKRFQAIVNASSDGIIVVDREGIVQFVNPAAAALFERSSEELLGSMFGFPVVAGGITELDILRKSGAPAVGEMRVVELEWEGSTAYLALLRDVTQTKQAQKELQSLYNAVSYLFKSDDLQNLAQQIAAAVVREFEHVDCGVLLVNGPHKDKIIRLARAGEYQVNTTYELSLEGPGLVPEAIKSGTIVYAPNVGTHPDYIANIPQTRSELVIPLQTASGTLGVLDLQSTKVSAFTQAQQRILAAFAERAAAAIENMQLYEEVNRHSIELEWRVASRTADLAQSKEQVEAILNNVSDAIVLVRPDGTIRQTNPAFCTLFGWTTYELLNVPLARLLKVDGFNLKEAFYRALHYDDSTRIEVNGRRKNGENFVAEVAFARTGQANTQNVSIICSLRDITERKQIEENLRKSLVRERELNDLKTIFVSMASHEFRTPLATISSSADLLSAYRDRMDNGQIDDKLNDIMEQVNHLTHVMDDVLDLGRLQSGRNVLSPTVLDLNILCQDIIQKFKNSSNIKQEIIYSCPEKSLNVCLDETLIRQTIGNLLSNASKYTPGNTTIFIDVEKSANSIVLCVRDQGIGIPQENLNNLFEPFYRADNVGTVSGTGLGLSIAKQAVELHKGSIGVKSQLGQGTTFVVTLPLIDKGKVGYDQDPGD